ncbi:MAG: hypothetical protein HY246_01330, partial [Proteobacteria bacterium]|nr:hypothetical protein [Pseudomonadota bacterium]
MVDIEPPPVPTRATTLRRPPPRIFFRRIGQLLLLLGASAVFAVLATHFVPAIGVYVAALIVVVVVLLAVPYKLIAVLRDRVGTCPFCAAMLGTGNEAALRYRAKPELVR